MPKTVLLPSYEHPEDTTSDSFSNLVSPLDWENMFGYVGFPAFMKPFAGGGWKHVYKLKTAKNFSKSIVIRESWSCSCRRASNSIHISVAIV